MSHCISTRFFDIFNKLSSISIDGFQREKFVIKIKHLSDSAIKAQDELLEEEKIVEEGGLAVQD